MRGVLIGFIILLLGTTAIASWIAAERLQKIERLDRETAKLNEQVGRLRGELRFVLAGAGPSTNPMAQDEPLPGAEALEFKTSADIEAAVQKLGAAPTAQAIRTNSAPP